MRALLFVPILALVACGGDSASTSDSSSRPNETVEADVAPCDALTPAMVAAVFGVPESAISVPEPPENLDSMMDIVAEQLAKSCSYDIAGDGNYEGASVSVNAYRDADRAETTFNGSYQTKTEEQISAIEDAGNRAAEEMEADGRDVSALEGENAGGMLAGLASKITYDDVPGIGDQAALETNRIVDPPQPAAVHVRNGAVVYSVSVSPEYMFSQQQASFDEIRDKTIDLGRLVAAAR